MRLILVHVLLPRQAPRHLQLIRKGAWRDNIFVERLWRSVKYEDIYLHAYETPSDVKQGLQRYFAFYTTRRPHRAHTGQTPDTAYCNLLPVAEVA